jgi:hypothetical protein
MRSRNFEEMLTRGGVTGPVRRGGAYGGLPLS